jgi:hypothetical protein
MTRILGLSRILCGLTLVSARSVRAIPLAARLRHAMAVLTGLPRRLRREREAKEHLEGDGESGEIARRPDISKAGRREDREGEVDGVDARQRLSESRDAPPAQSPVERCERERDQEHGAEKQNERRSASPVPRCQPAVVGWL